MSNAADPVLCGEYSVTKPYSESVSISIVWNRGRLLFAPVLHKVETHRKIADARVTVTNVHFDWAMPATRSHFTGFAFKFLADWRECSSTPCAHEPSERHWWKWNRLRSRLKAAHTDTAYTRFYSKEWSHALTFSQFIRIEKAGPAEKPAVFSISATR